jgi:hypothetical protein
MQAGKAAPLNLWSVDPLQQHIYQMIVPNHFATYILLDNLWMCFQPSGAGISSEVLPTLVQDVLTRPEDGHEINALARRKQQGHYLLGGSHSVSGQ